jgi:hypothetical protein
MQKDLVIFDLDGTLALVDHRRHYVTNGNQQWDEFHKACVNDEANWPVIHTLMSLFRSGADVFIVSGRSDLVRLETEDWLLKHGIPFDGLIMRKHGDYTPDDILKLSWMNDGTIPKHRIKMVFDDRDKVVKMWREQGITCFQVAEGNF